MNQLTMKPPIMTMTMTIMLRKTSVKFSYKSRNMSLKNSFIIQRILLDVAP